MAFWENNFNKFHKGFMTTVQGGFEDPTYLGFKLAFDFDPTHRNFENGMTDDPLFSTDASLESAQRYLKATGFSNRAEMLERFKQNLRFINTQSPWFFQSITGLNELWKIEHGENFNPFRGKDKVLEISCLESIDMRLTALADSYRKATYDAKFMRFLLPENLMWFTLRVQVCEMRSFHKISDAINKINPAIFTVNPNLETTPKIPLALNRDSGHSSHEASFEEVKDLVSLMEFHLTHCTFDFSESFPSDGPISMDGNMNMAKQKFKINVGHISETHSYKLMDLVLKDGVNQENGNGLSQRMPDFDKAFNTRSDNILTSTILGLQNNLQDRLNQISGIPGNLIARGVNMASEAVNRVVLGNVYDLRNQSAAGILNSFLGKNEQLGAPPLGREDVYPNVPGTDLSTAKSVDLGNAYDPTGPVKLEEDLGNIYK